MARDGRINAADHRRFFRGLVLGGVRLQDGVAGAPAETQRADLVSPRDLPHAVDEARHDGLGHRLAVLDQPRSQRRRHGGRVLRLVQQPQLLAHLERRLHALQELDVEAVAEVDVRNVHGEVARFGVVVGEEAEVGEFPPEDVGNEDHGGAFVGRDGSGRLV